MSERGRAARDVMQLAQAGNWHAFAVSKPSRLFFGLLKKEHPCCASWTRRGHPPAKDDARVLMVPKCELKERLPALIDEMTTYNDGARCCPKSFLYFRQKAADLSGVTEKEQLMPLVDLELEFVGDGDGHRRGRKGVNDGNDGSWAAFPTRCLHSAI